MNTIANAAHHTHLAAHTAALFAAGRTTGITFVETQDGTDASATYTRGDIEASLYVQPTQDDGMVFAVGLLDRRDSDYTLVIDFTTESLPDASRVLALAALMARAPETAAAWFEEQGMHVDTAPLLAATGSLETLPARILASAEPAIVAAEPEPEPVRPYSGHAFGIPVVFDVAGVESREAATRAVARFLPEVKGYSAVESWWFPEDADRATVPNDNLPMTLVPAEGTEAQTVADLDGSDDAASWLIPGHVLTADEVAYLRALRLP